MKLSLALCTLLTASSVARADTIFRIEVGQDPSQYRDSDLKRRIWELERAVWQLQQKVFQLESKPTARGVDTWVCKIKAMSELHTATGPSKAVATDKVLDKCKSANGGSGFFCTDIKCEQ